LFDTLAVRKTFCDSRGVAVAFRIFTWNGRLS